MIPTEITEWIAQVPWARSVTLECRMDGLVAYPTVIVRDVSTITHRFFESSVSFANALEDAVQYVRENP